MFIDAMAKRLENGEPMTLREKQLVDVFVKKLLPEYKLVRRRIKCKQTVGEKSDAPINPVTGNYYIGKRSRMLTKAMLENKLIGQFAGKNQWASVGRVVRFDDYIPVFRNKAKNGDGIEIYAYEQTSSMYIQVDHK